MAVLDEHLEALKDPHLLTAYCESRLEKRGAKNYVCPICKSGTGPNHTAAFTVRGGKWKCFACGKSGDLLDLMGFVEGIEDFQEQAEAASQWAGIGGEYRGANTGFSKSTIAAARYALVSEMVRTNKTDTAQKWPEAEDQSHEAARSTELEKVLKWRERIHDDEAASFLRARGIDAETAEAWHLGYDPDRKRIVIPYRGAEWYHTDRDITGEHEHKYMKPKSADIGPAPLWNAEALKKDAYFAVEGELDALAIEWAGYPAIAAGGTSGANRLAEEAASTGSEAVAIILFDCDKAGEKGANDLATALKERGLKYMLADAHEYLEPQKDPQQLMQEDPDGLREITRTLYARAAEEARRQEEEDYQAALDRAHVIAPDVVASSIYNMTDPWEYVPTGIEPLDRILGGGIPARGVVVFGAVSSAGKTTMLVQIADHIASQGRPVLFCTVEQSAQELTAKSLSRIINTLYADERHKPYCLTAASIMSAWSRAAWSDMDHDALWGAVEWYNHYIAPNLRYMEPEGRPTVGEICTVARRMARKSGQAPVLMLDYLQLVQPEDPHATDKQATDQAMTALRQLARELRTPVIVVSSLNRASYVGGIHEDSWKESGGVEYGADCLLGMQPYGLEAAIKAAPAGKKVQVAQDIIATFKQNPSRECELICLKNRNGRIPNTRPKVTLEAAVSRFWWDQFWWNDHGTAGLTASASYGMEDPEEEE